MAGKSLPVRLQRAGRAKIHLATNGNNHVNVAVRPGLCHVRPMMQSLQYTGGTLDRGERFRRDENWLRARLGDGHSRVFPLWRGRNLVSVGEPPRPTELPPDPSLMERAEQIVFLGIDECKRACFAVDVSAADEAALGDIVEGSRFVELRRVGAIIGQADGALLAHARGLLYWHRQHRFCGACGAPTESRAGGHIRACTRSGCGAQHFPHVDPAVIMLVTRLARDGELCLLARQANWPRGMMSTLAGFVEPGESLEEAVRREIEEESGIRVALPHYRGSQPWPFPGSLMIGFRAEAESGSTLRLDPAELEDARWFSRDEIRARKNIGLVLPGRDSIARRLIEEWLKAPETAEG